MDDTISRQAAIDAVCAVCGNDCDKSKFVYNAPQDEQVILCPEHYVLCTLPSAQPDRSLWFRIGEVCVNESKGDITAEVAIEKIRALLKAERREE